MITDIYFWYNIEGQLIRDDNIMLLLSLNNQEEQYYYGVSGGY